MKVLDIIEKEESERTAEEIQYCFDVFTQRDNTISCLLELKDFPKFNSYLNNLRLLSKTRLHLFNYCPFKFKCNYLLKLRIESNLEIMIVGKNLHLINQEFWDDFSPELFKKSVQLEYNSIYKFIKQNYMKFIPSVKLTTHEEELIHNFVDFETKRCITILTDVGFTIENIAKYIKPLFNELSIENWGLKLMGIIDRGDLLTNGAKALVEYKYGKPKYFGTYKEKNITQEMAFYNILVQKNALAVLNKDGKDYCVPLKELLGFEPKFYYGSMIFFQDAENTGKMFKIKNIYMTSVLNQIKKYWKAMETGLYYPRPNNSCFEWCEYYWDICEHNKCWQEIEKAMDD